jgi:hypothetical protein
MDQELGIPLEGAEIRSFDGRAYQGDEEGRVTITVPDDRQVVVRGSYPGYTIGRLIIDTEKNEFVMELRLTGVTETRELVLEESRPGETESRTGRSVAISEHEIQRTGEIGVIEDVMSSIKLLPGVGYSGLFNAMPSIRGGQPGEFMAAMDGFYITNPYHWGGGFSIFDPRMVQSAQLSHGVFSVRYGHTVSGLLDITTKKPSTQDVEFELGLSTSAANANLSFPINRRGGVMVMGKVTYYDPVIWLAQQISKASNLEELEPVEAISTAPYIRSVSLTSAYRFTDRLETSFTGFFGADGVAAEYANEGGIDDASGTSLLGSYSSMEMAGHWINYQGFGLLGATYNPRNTMVLKAGLGAGYRASEVEGHIGYSVQDIPFSDALRLRDPSLPAAFSYDTKEGIFQTISSTDVQGRVDFDWDLGRGFLAALGVQELYSQMRGDVDLPLRLEIPSRYYALLNPGFVPAADYVSYWATLQGEAEKNDSLVSSGYLLVEYGSPARRFEAELGLRLDHLYYAGNGFSIGADPVLSPRLNLDFNIFKNKGPVESLSVSLGTGLFSSTHDALGILQTEMPSGFVLKPTRSLTTVGGIKIELPRSVSIDIEGYYKYIFDRTYAFTDPVMSPWDIHFDGEGRIWGLDLLLKKLEGRYLDGWISYSYINAQYREPGVPGDPNLFRNIEGSVSNDWYYPSFHRFHVLNLILNIKATEKFTITTRFGLASGVPLSTVVTGKQPYSVEVLDPTGTRINIIQKWKQLVSRDTSNRTSFSIPMDIKFSIFRFRPHGKAHQEFYVAIENVLSLVHTPKGNTTFNIYTGEEDTGSMSASYDIPIPIPSFGFKWSY